MLKLFIIDNQSLFSSSLKFFIENNFSNYEVIGQAKYGFDFIEAIDKKNCRPDILFLSINIPDNDYLYVLDELKKRRFKIKIILILSEFKLDIFPRIFKYNFDALIFKTATYKEIFNSLNAVSNNQKYFTHKYISLINLFIISNNFESKKCDSLSGREIEILSYVAQGKSNKEIAIDLCISERTVKNHLFNIFSKINCADRTQATLFYLRNNITSF